MRHEYTRHAQHTSRTLFCVSSLRHTADARRDPPKLTKAAPATGRQSATGASRHQFTFLAELRSGLSVVSTAYCVAHQRCCQSNHLRAGHYVRPQCAFCDGSALCVAVRVGREGHVTGCGPSWPCACRVLSSRPLHRRVAAARSRIVFSASPQRQSDRLGQCHGARCSRQFVCGLLPVSALQAPEGVGVEVYRAPRHRRALLAGHASR